MPVTEISVLLTRTAAGCEDFARRLEARLGDIRVVQSPLIAIKPTVPAVDLAGYEGVVFTSSNAVKVAAGLGADPVLPAYCLGAATTALAARSGWSAQQCGQDAKSLITQISDYSPQGPLLHLTGVHTRGDVAAALTGAGIQTDAISIYDQPLLSLTDPAISLLEGGTTVIVPLFSPRTAAHFCKTAPFSESAVLVAMSEAVAQSVTGRWRDLMTIATAPTAEAMTDAVEKQVNRLSRVERRGAGH